MALRRLQDNRLKHSATSRQSLLTGLDHRNLRGQLQIDQEVNAAIDLVPQCSLLGRPLPLNHQPLF
jgi:hypothetical protein